MITHRRLYRITLREWDHTLKSDFYFAFGPEGGGTVQILQMLESDLGQDLDEVKNVEEVDELLVYLPSA